MAGWFDAVRARLWDMLCDGSVIRDANFLKLTKPDDGDNFKEDKFSQHCLDHFLCTSSSSLSVIKVT
jgi:hypothetical protein